MRQVLQTQQSSRHYLASKQTSTAEQASELTVQRKRSLALPMLRLNHYSKQPCWRKDASRIGFAEPERCRVLTDGTRAITLRQRPMTHPAG